MTKSNTHNRAAEPSRRRFIKAAAAITGATLPNVWIQNPAFAQTAARGMVKHLIYIRLNGGFRFTCAYNGDVAPQFNPFGLAQNLPSGTQWGPSALLQGADWLTGDDGQALADLGVGRFTDFANEVAVMPCVDHEPFAGNADGNHGSGLERYYTGYVGGSDSFFTMIHYGIRERIAAAAASGNIVLPPFVMGGAGMALGQGKYAAYRPPLIQGDSLDGFTFEVGSNLPAWAHTMSVRADERMRDRQVVPSRAMVNAYIGARESTQKFAQIFASDALQIQNNSDEAFDGISNRELATLIGDSGPARRLRLGLRLFSHGSPALYLDEGGYDMHSGEEMQLPIALNSLNRLLSGTRVALKRMTHPSGGSFWDHTLIVLGSEFGRTTRGTRFNSALGSDHGGDRATRWMSMPLMGGVVDAAGLGGARLGATAPDDLRPTGEVYSYRALMKTLLDLLGADHADFFPADAPIAGIF